ncbi:MAG: hypothetical protein CVV53_06330 [Spirochaetae bacterium HGW-Spirochaetae-9]|nr:MAG: hypothetical protein CVV53_06330 [Spirochaetae bacterium HGW-Spirochaetae-9]
MADSYIIAGATIVLADKLLEAGVLVVRDDRIEHIGAESLKSYLAAHPGDRNLALIEGADSFVAPRLVEMHIHGAFGIGFERISGAGDLIAMAEKLEARGVGCFVPTILWDEGAVTRLVEALEASNLPVSVVPGIYIEGPFVNPERRGGIGLGQIVDPDPDLCRKIIATARGRLKVMALAPELPGIKALYPILEEAGVLVSLGHSGAHADVALPPRFSVTHLFNAMSGLDHRGGGLVNIALAGIPSWTELNADGIHVNPSCMKVASLCIPPERLILTSDAVISAGLPYGDFSYFGKPVASGTDGVRYKGPGTLIGSNRLGMEIVKSFIAATGASLPAAIQSMGAAPSKALRLPSGEGGASIEIGAVADIFIWDASLSSCRRPGLSLNTPAKGVQR